MKKLMLTLLAAAMILAPAVAQNRVKYLSTSTASLNVQDLNVADQTVQINRILFAGYNTLCLPMTLSAEQLQAAAKDVRVERLAAMREEGTTLSLYFVDCTAEGIQAGVPYLIFSPTMQNLRARTTDAQGISTDLQTISLTDNVGNRISFNSSYASVTGNGRRYGIPAKQDVEVLESVLLPTDGEKTFLPTRCGITWEQQGAATTLEVKHAMAEDITAINAVNGTRAESVVYDLSGRRVAGNAHNGIFVVDGKKKAIK